MAVTDPTYTRWGFSDAEWGLLVGLPQAVLTAAGAAEIDGARASRAENAAGLETISRGRESADPLVAAVAEELVSRVGDPEAGEELPVRTPRDPAVTIAEAIERAQSAAHLLAHRVDEGSSGAYKHWLVEIAEQVVGAAASGGVLGLGGDQVTESERRFRDRLATALQG